MLVGKINIVEHKVNIISLPLPHGASLVRWHIILGTTWTILKNMVFAQLKTLKALVTKMIHFNLIQNNFASIHMGLYWLIETFGNSGTKFNIFFQKWFYIKIVIQISIEESQEIFRFSKTRQKYDQVTTFLTKWLTNMHSNKSDAFRR